ncbi:MAG: SAM-dependent methyltransferase [Gallionella sp.]|nr:SAM-dependent methyltransferase [Gallionella sp.]MDD4959476.1 SAM-dependent methyltransferase [Gallionella sp.]
MSSHSDSKLPLPEPAAAEHSARLTALIQQEIAAQGGWISFARFMELALYAPTLGYYTAGAHKLGAAGDFTTAPELSHLYGQTLARQMAQIMAGSAPYLLELGAGSGKLAEDMLAELEVLGSLPECYYILEVSADLRARQQARLQPRWQDRVVWLDALPDAFSGAIVANEVLDALPVHLVEWREEGVQERGVAWDGAAFVWQSRDIANADLLAAAHALNPPAPYLSEICLAARGLIHSLAMRLQQGAMVWIDYGFGAREYYHPQRNSGTLMCHYRHYAHDDPFFLLGLQDLTAHVNFTDIAECGIDSGLELLGYTNQAFFLINSGITDLLKSTSPDDVRAYAPLSAQLQKLTSPAEMGELFKVIALGKNFAVPLAGFARGDLSRSL